MLNSRDSGDADDENNVDIGDSSPSPSPVRNNYTIEMQDQLIKVASKECTKKKPDISAINAVLSASFQERREWLVHTSLDRNSRALAVMEKYPCFGNEQLVSCK